MKVLLAHRCHDGGIDDPAVSALPPHLPWAAAALRAAGHQPVLANFSRLGWRDAERFIGDAAPDVLVATCSTPDRRAAVRLLRVGRRAVPDLVTALDGAHARALGLMLAQRTREVDFIVTGDPLRVLPLACAALVAEGRPGLLGVPGVLTKVGGQPPVGAPVELDSLPDPLAGLEAAGIVAGRDLSRVLVSRGGDGEEPLRLRSARSIARELRTLRDEHGVLAVSFVGAGLVGDRQHLQDLGDSIRAAKCGVAWELRASVDELLPVAGVRSDAQFLSGALIAAERAGCRRVEVVLDVRETRAAGEDLGARVASAASLLREHGLAPAVTVRHAASDETVEDVARLRTLIRAFRPRSGRIEVRLLEPGSEDWLAYAEAAEVGDNFWFEEDREAIPAGPPRQVEVAAQALEVTLQRACREAQPAPRELGVAQRRLEPSAWALIDWGDYRADSGDLDEAERHFRAAAELEPWNPFPWLHLAAAAGARPELEAEALRAVLNRAPKHEASRERLTALRRRRGDAAWRRDD